jgi:glyoxylase-like metal-dependent hydrolase (beta-lactamase superfamily II)
VIKGNGRVAMVDVGYNNKDYAKEFAESLFVENWHSPRVVLAEVGLTPEDVDTVLISHAHFDHFGNVGDFPNATFYIQEREIAKWVWAMSLPERMRFLLTRYPQWSRTGAAKALGLCRRRYGQRTAGNRSALCTRYPYVWLDVVFGTK